MKRILFYMLLIFLTFFDSSAQWQQEWASPSTSGLFYSGWIAFAEVNNERDYKYYIINDADIKIMDGAYSSTPLYQYKFTDAEIFGGNQIYSLGTDLTGDNITEFYVLSYYGTAEPYRQSFKIFDITTGQVILEKNSPDYYYSYPVIWDADNDGVLECSFSVYDYPNFANYTYEVYNTNITTSIASDAAVPASFNLKQNYPNPFNPTTTIEFDLMKEQNLSLTIFDTLGRRVTTLVNKRLSPGNHKVDFNGKDLASGNYFYQLKTNSKVKTKKMSIIK